MPSLTRDAINFSWLIKLRWAAILGQLITIIGVVRVLGIELDLPWLLGVIALELTTNLVCAALARRAYRVREWWSGSVIALDVITLTALLHFSGGPFNPFSFLYLVEIAISAAVLRARWTWALVVVSLVCSGALFVINRDGFLSGVSHADHMRLHLRGMWVAFGVAATFIVYFLMRVRRDLDEREAELADAERRATRQERLASLATLAAGAAHELATPLGTIALVARELERHLASVLSEDEMAREDVRLIGVQVARCRMILDSMAAEAGQSAGELSSEVELAALLQAAMNGLRDEPRIELDLGSIERQRVVVPVRAVAQAVKSLIKNAQEASTSSVPVKISASVDDGVVRIEIVDQGRGMPADVLARAGEPFFTTKDAGRGMGLGLFLTRTVLERVGGELELLSSESAGTRAVVRLPLPPAKIDRMDAAAHI